VYHRSVCRVISGCLASAVATRIAHPPAGNHTEPSSTHFQQTGPLLSCRQFFPTTVSLLPSTTQIKEETLLAILLFNTGKPGPQRKTDLVPTHSPLNPPNFTVTTFIEGCSRSDPGRSDTVADFLWSLPTTDVVVWTDGSVPSPLGAGDAGIHAVRRRCSLGDDYKNFF